MLYELVHVPVSRRVKTSLGSLAELHEVKPVGRFQHTCTHEHTHTDVSEGANTARKETKGIGRE